MLTLFEGIRIANMIECDSYTINQYNEYSSRYDYNDLRYSFTFNNDEDIIEVFSIGNNGYIYYNVCEINKKFITPVMLISTNYIDWIEKMQSNPNFYRGMYKKIWYKMAMLISAYVEVWYMTIKKSKEWTPKNITKYTIALCELADVKRFLKLEEV